MENFPSKKSIVFFDGFFRWIFLMDFLIEFCSKRIQMLMFLIDCYVRARLCFARFFKSNVSFGLRYVRFYRGVR